MKKTRNHYTDEQIEFIENLNDKCYNDEIIEKFKEQFGIELTKSKLCHLKNKRRILRVEKTYRINSCKYRYGKKEFLTDLYFKGLSHKDIIELYNKEFDEDLDEVRLNTFLQWNVPDRKRYVMFTEDERKFFIDLINKDENVYKIKKQLKDKFGKNISIKYLQKIKRLCGKANGDVTIFYDNDINNANNNNIIVLSRSDYCYLVRKDLHKSNKQIKKVALNIKKLNDKSKQKLKEYSIDNISFL